MTKLLQNGVLKGLPKAEVEAYVAENKVTRAKYVAMPVVDDTEFATFDKMGLIRRSEATDTVKVLRDYQSALSPALSLAVVDNGLSVFDNADTAIDYHKKALADWIRIKAMGGITALNMIKCCEEHLYHVANQGNESGILAKNAIEKLSRSSDKKSGSKSDKNDKSSKNDKPTDTPPAK